MQQAELPRREQVGPDQTERVVNLVGLRLEDRHKYNCMVGACLLSSRIMSSVDCFSVIPGMPTLQ